MRIAASKGGQSFDEPAIVQTPENFKEGMALFRDIAAKLAGGEKIEAAAGGIAGPLNSAKTKLANSPNISGWIEKPLKEELGKLLKSPIYLENDADIAGLGEAVYGAGRGKKIVAYLTISTGVGGGRVVDGRIDANAAGFEPGHQIIDFNGPICQSCGVSGHLEEYVSGTAFEKKYGKKAYEITDPEAWEEAAEILACGLNNTIVHWSPNIVILGGSMMNKPGISVERVRFHLKNILKIFPKPPFVEKAELGDFGGLYGALAILKETEISPEVQLRKD